MFSESYECDTCGNDIETGFYFRYDDSDPWQDTFSGAVPEDGAILKCQRCQKRGFE